MSDLFTAKRHEGEIVEKRARIAGLLTLKSANIKNGAVGAIAADDLKLLFGLYDEIFFKNWFITNFKGRLRFSLSRRMTASAGLTLCPRNPERLRPEELVIEIRIGVDFFLHYGLIKGSKTVCGVKTSCGLEALLLVFEHELCHAAEFILFNKSSCKGKRFKAMANNLFGHTESCHKLPTHRQIARQRLGLKIGDKVSFTFEGKRLTGTVYNINKRATVMVRNDGGPLVDAAGNRYSKFYVPLMLLE